MELVLYKKNIREKELFTSQEESSQQKPTILAP